MNVSRPPAHFADMYGRNPDPWGFATSAAEAQKYDATLAALPAGPFQRGLEAGCSIGVLTSRLAARCKRLVAVDVVPAALAAAQARCARTPHVSFALLHMPRKWPTGIFDLIVLSEILYFFSRADIRLMAARVSRSLAPGGLVLLVNYTGKLDDPCSGDEAAQTFMRTSPRLRLKRQVVASSYRIDLLSG